MSPSSVKNRLRKLERRAEDGRKLILLPMSNLEAAHRIMYLLEKKPNEAAARRIEELLEIARQRKEAAERGTSL
jgi:hypothetical protein